MHHDYRELTLLTVLQSIAFPLRMRHQPSYYIELRELSSVLRDNLEGWDWGEVGGRIKREEIHVFL